MQSGEQFFRGIIWEPDGPEETVVLRKGAKALAERIATKEAARRNWDWRVEHCRVDGSGEDQKITVLEYWSSVAEHEVIESGCQRR